MNLLRWATVHWAAMYWVGATCALVAVVPNPAHAEPVAETNTDVGPRVQPFSTRYDGVYGRFDGDLDLGLALGVAQLADQTSLGLRPTLHYFSTAGLWAMATWPLSTPEDSAGNSLGTSSLALGVDLKPAFLPRFSYDLEKGPAWLDLCVDSISLAAGPYWAFPTTDSVAVRSRGLELSLGFGLPLLGSAHGPWLEARALARFPDSAASTDFGAMLLFSWHTLFASFMNQQTRVR